MEPVPKTKFKKDVRHVQVFAHFPLAEVEKLFWKSLGMRDYPEPNCSLCVVSINRRIHYAID
jgi:hypothetical protein